MFTEEMFTEEGDKIPLINSSREETDAKSNENEEKSYNCIIRWCLPQQLRRHWKTIFLAVFLFMAGLLFFIIGIYIISLPNSVNGPHSYVLILCGVLCIIPGGYHVVYIYYAARGRAGYKMEELPTFDGT